jgi:integrase
VEHKKLHATRHAFATRSLEVGVDIKTVSDALGHSSPIITVTCYAHSLEEQKRHAAECLNAFFTKPKSLKD